MNRLAQAWAVWTLFTVGWDVTLWAMGRYAIATMFVAVVVLSLVMTNYSKRAF